MNFSYFARDPLGNDRRGTITAGSEADARKLLHRDGMQLMSLRVAEDEDEDSDENMSLIPKRVSKTDIIYVTSQLAIMVDTGITLSTALDGILQQEENPTLKQVLTDIKRNVEAGEDFSTALGRHPKYFDKIYVALVRASEHTGTLGAMLERIAAYQRNEVDNRGKVKAALAYPAVMLVIAVGVTIFMLTFILPKFEPLFAQKGASLPTVTVYMMAASDSLIGGWYLWILLLVAAVVGTVLLVRTEAGRKLVDRFRINLPIIGPMSRKVVISRSVRTLGTMIASGVSVLDALRLSAEVAGNYHYEQLWLGTLEQVTAGRQINEALAGNPLLPATLVQMIGSGEETGKLDEVLNKVSNYYDQEVETTLKATTSLIEPIMILTMGIIVGTIALGLLMPIFQLSRPG